MKENLWDQIVDGWMAFNNSGRKNTEFPSLRGFFLRPSFQVGDFTERDMVHENNVLLRTAAANRKSRKLPAGTADAGQGSDSSENIARRTRTAPDFFSRIGIIRDRRFLVLLKRARGYGDRLPFQGCFGQLDFFYVRGFISDHPNVRFDKWLIPDIADLQFMDVFFHALDEVPSLHIRHGAAHRPCDNYVRAHQRLLRRLVDDLSPNASLLLGEQI